MSLPVPMHYYTLNTSVTIILILSKLQDWWSTGASCRLKTPRLQSMAHYVTLPLELYWWGINDLLSGLTGSYETYGSYTCMHMHKPPFLRSYWISAVSRSDCRPEPWWPPASSLRGPEIGGYYRLHAAGKRFSVVMWAPSEKSFKSFICKREAYFSYYFSVGMLQADTSTQALVHLMEGWQRSRGIDPEGVAVETREKDDVSRCLLCNLMKKLLSTSEPSTHIQVMPD